MAENPVYDQAIRWLARRSYGVEELRRRLKERTGADDAIIAEVLERCLAAGYLDDGDFARSLVRERMEVRRQGVVRVRQELRRRGVEEEVIREALDGAEVDAEEVARELVRRRFGDVPPGEAREWRRRYDFLARRGYESDVIRRALKTPDGPDEE